MYSFDAGKCWLEHELDALSNAGESDEGAAGEEMQGKAVRISLPLPVHEAAQVKRACELGEARMCTLFGIHMLPDEKVKGKRIGKFLQKGCALGDSNGCLVLSQM